MLTHSYTYRTTQAPILLPVDLELVREKVLREMERLKLNPTQLADRADLNQSNIAKWLRTRQSITETRARVLFRIIERGLGQSLAEFFGEIEGGTQSAARPTPQGGPRHGDRVSPSIVGDPRLAQLLGRSLIDAGTKLVAGSVGVAPAESDSAVALPRRHPPSRRKRRAGNR